MDSACVRIKFVPLVKECKNDSKCQLEIVPEISCIKNFEKLNWKAGRNYLEYIFPVEYKIILKKKESTTHADNLDNLDKTYHSCVDLLNPPSTFDFNNSGDLTRFVSDNCIFGKLMDELTDAKKLNIILESVNENTKQKLDTSGNLFLNNNNQLFTKVSPNQLVEANLPNNTEIDLLNKSINQVCNYILFDKITPKRPFKSKEYKKVSGYVNQNLLPHKEKENSQQLYDQNGYKDSKRLSRSALSSFDTYDHIKHKKLKSNRSPVVYHMIECPEKLVPYKKIQDTLKPTARMVSDINMKSFLVKKTNERSQEILRTADKRSLNKTVTPHTNERIAQFLLLMNKEIMPLHIMLEEIKNKCAILGVKINFTEEKRQFQRDITMKLASLSGNQRPTKKLCLMSVSEL